ncbi:MAG: hypothetical protein EON59_01665 [Alphaproteobacteria bacterium]|nr:MAG: hypothetical protein EON59_01665 [Alphaproteobacteria bacterium]
MSSGDSIIIENPHRDPRSSPFLFIPLFENDRGDPALRVDHPNIAGRTPLGVKWEPGKVLFTIANSGLVASDLIRVDYEIRLCTFPGHGPADGFVVDHAGEAMGSTKADVGRIDFVPAGASRPLPPITVVATEAGGAWPDWLANIYVRARVSSLFSPDVPVTRWDFAVDPAVTEATLRLA